MGNQGCCSTRQRSKTEILDRNEQLTLNEVFKYYANQQQETYGQQFLTRESIQRMFADSQHFAQNLYDYCASQCNQRLIPFSLMAEIICGFIKTTENRFIEFTQLELLTLLMMGKFNLRNKEDKQVLSQLWSLSISTNQAFQIFMFLLQMFSICTTKRISSFENKTIEALIQGIFGPLNIIGSTRFTEQVEQYFPLVQQLIRSYFALKFLQRPFNGIKAPKISEESSIISKDHIAIMSLASSELHRFDQMSLSYTSKGHNFYNFMNILLQSGQNSLILLEFEKNVVYAIYNQSEWFPDMNEQEFTEGHVIFQLKPQVHVYTAKQLRQKNFRQSPPVNYIHIIDGAVNQDHIGFGVAKDSLSAAFMIWLGPQECYISQEGQQINTTLKSCEIWVLTSSTINAQELVKERNSYIARKSLNRKSALQLQRATAQNQSQYLQQDFIFDQKNNEYQITQSQLTSQDFIFDQKYKPNNEIGIVKKLESPLQDLNFSPQYDSFQPVQIFPSTSHSPRFQENRGRLSIKINYYQFRFNPQYQFNNPRSTSNNLIDERRIEGRKSQAIIDKYKKKQTTPNQNIMTQI